MRIMPNMAEAMTPFPHTIESNESVEVAKKIMASQNIRHLPVMEGGVLLGILTDRDLKLSFAVTNNEQEISKMPVGEICVTEVYTVDHSDSLRNVVGYMAKNHIGSAIVLKNRKVVGIFTTTDACRKLEELLSITYPDA
jgi:acetoin utilization protein AcuB